MMAGRVDLRTSASVNIWLCLGESRGENATWCGENNRRPDSLHGTPPPSSLSPL